MGTPRNGRIITFYSYKGGTGRSMALANVAWILASNGKRVLTLDWDMEAPGLHRYFFPFLIDKDLTGSDGIIDFVIKYATAAATPHSLDTPDQVEERPRPPEDGEKWYEPYANILRYATSLDWKFDAEGTLDFIPSGRQGSSYATRVNSFNWKRFYEVLGGGTLLEIAKRKMREEYDYILVDSRTGVSDTSGICTVQMPDTLVICFTLNNQSILGASAVAYDIYDQRTQLAHIFSDTGGSAPRRQSGESIEIFPVPTRVENAEKMKLQTRKEYAKEVFSLFPNTVPGEEREAYWGNVPIIYVPYYAYEEILAPFGDNSADRISILAAAEQLTSYLTGGEVSKLPAIRNEERDRILRQYETGVQEADPARKENALAESAFKRLTGDEQARAHRLLTRLVRVAGEGEAGGDAPLRVAVKALPAEDAPVLRRLINLGLVEKDYDFRTETETVSLKPDTLIRNWERLGDWLKDDREFLLWRQRLQTKIDEWEKSSRDAGALLSGTLLAEARTWREGRGPDLNAPESEFIRESDEAEQRIEQERRKVEERLARERKEAEGRRLLRRRLVWGLPVAIVILLAGFFTALYPYKRIVLDDTIFVSHDRWIISADRSVAVSFTKGRISTLWRRGGSLENRPPLTMPFDNLAVSPRGTYLAGVTGDGKLYVWKSAETLSVDARPLLTYTPPNPDDNRSYGYYVPGFTQDERRVYIGTPDGLYIMEVGKEISGTPKPFFIPKTDNKRGSNSPFPSDIQNYTFAFSPRGTFVAITDTDDRLFVKRLDDPPDAPTPPPFNTDYERSYSTMGVSFSDDEKFIATTSKTKAPKNTLRSVEKQSAYIADLRNFPSLEFKQVLSVNAADTIGFQDYPFLIFFSPDNKWVLCKQVFGGVYAWPIDRPPGDQAKPVIEHTRGSATNSFQPVGFSPDGRWAAVKASDTSLYVWELDKTDTAPLTPIFKGDEKRGFGRSEAPGFAFSPNGDWVAGNSSGGSIFLWELGHPPDFSKPTTFLGSNSTNYAWSTNGRSIYIYGGGDISLIEPPGKIVEQVEKQPSNIVALTLNSTDVNGSEELVIFDEHHLSRARRQAFFWNIPIRTYLWPQMKQVADDADDE